MYQQHITIYLLYGLFLIMHLLNIYFTTHLLIVYTILHNLNLNCLQYELHHLHFQVQVILHIFISL